MIATCPHCGRRLKVDDTLAGQEGQCPVCQRSFTIRPQPIDASAQPPMPGVTPPGAAAPPPLSPTDAPAPASPPPERPDGAKAPAGMPPLPPRPTSSGVQLLQPEILAPAKPQGGFSMRWTVLAVIGGGLMIAAFFVPWWGITFKPYVVPEKQPSATVMKAYETEAAEVERILLSNAKFYLDHLSLVFLANFDRDKAVVRGDDARAIAEPTTERLFGWNCATGIVGLIFGCLIVLAAVVFVILPFLRRWAWVGMLPAAVLAIIELILALVFWLGTPGADTRSILSQGVILGPFIALGGSLAACVAAGIMGVTGAIRFARKFLPAVATD